MYDVVIVGGGPAGATLARLVDPRLRTLLLERRPPEGGAAEGARRAKVCGGLLAPDAQRALAALGLGVPREVLAGPQLFAVRAIDATANLTRHYPRHYLNVDRGRFDFWLRSLVPLQVEVRHRSRVVGLRDEGDAVALAVEADGLEVVRGRLVVGADGAGSVVRRFAFPGAPAARLYLAIQGWFEARALDPCHTALFDPTITDFYGWAIPKADRLLVGAALRPGADAPPRFERLVERLRAAGLPLGRALTREGTFLARPTAPAHLVTGAGRVALVGEAAALVSPSSAEGISFALRSAALLARALEPGLSGWARRYRAAAGPLRRELLWKMLKVPVLFAPLPRRIVMASGLGAIPVGSGPPLAAAGQVQ